MIIENLKKIKLEIPDHVKLVAVSKKMPNVSIMEAYQTGHFLFGENIVQELLQKYESLPKDIEWHMIGHLQSNKVKFIVPFVSLIQSVDSLKLLEIIDNEALKNYRIIDCLLEVFIADEETKYGLDEQELEKLLTSETFSNLKNIRIRGLMGIATLSQDKSKIRNEFKKLNEIFHKIKSAYFINTDYFNELSMGMSGDYQIAVEEGSTIIRLGSAIFGDRQN